MNTKCILLATISVVTVGTAVSLLAVDEKPKYTVAEVMKALHKGDDSVGKRVSKGLGTKDDFDKLVEYYSSLPLNQPERGEPASWQVKTTALLESAKALQQGKPGALEEFNKASNCKACHSLHRPL